MKIGVLGSGNVGGTLGRAFARAGHDVVYGVRDVADTKHDGLRHARAELRPLGEVATASDVLVLATPWNATEAVLGQAGDLGGKPLLDATNPIGPGFALTHGHTDSGGEQVARWARTAKVVKVMNTTGVENMENPRYGDARAAMFLCGDDADACALAARLAEDIGFEAVRIGALSRSRELEPLAMLWITMAMVLGYGRGFAFGLLARRGGEPREAAGPADTSGPGLRVAVIGSGHIGGGLARAWRRTGHDVTFGARDPGAADVRALAEEIGAKVSSIADAVKAADVVAVAVPAGAVDAVLAAAGSLDGKVVIDCTNDVARGMTLAHGHTTSAAEILQAKIPGARVVKSFNAQGAENLAGPVYGGVRAANFVCGDDAETRKVVARLAADVGFQPVDVGPLRSARFVEPMMIVWVTASQALGTRDLAFRLLRRGSER